MKNKTLILIPALAFILAVSGCGKKETPRAVVNNNNAQPVNQDTNSNSSANTNTNANIPDEPKPVENGGGEEIDTSDWLTYRNEEYGFEVKYPKDWKYKKEVYQDENGNIEDTGLELEFSGSKNYFRLSAKTLEDAKNLDKKIDEPYFLFYFAEVPFVKGLLLPSRALIYGKDVYDQKKDLQKECLRSKRYITCYDYYPEGDSFYRYDVIYYNNTRYEFKIALFEGIDIRDLEDFSSENINKKADEKIMNEFMLGKFNEEDKKNIELVEKIKETLSFIN